MKHVLLIEDDTWLAESYMRMLMREGMRVRLVESADAAMTAIDEAVPDIVVADVLLNEHTIFMLFHELQSYEDTRDTPIVLCSSLGGDVLADAKLRQYGVRAVLDKSSLTPEQLVTVVQELSV